MEFLPGNNEPDRERLESLTRRYGRQPLGMAILGLFYVLYGLSWLIGHPVFVRRYDMLPLLSLVAVGTFLFPQFMMRFYYGPRFGYVKPLSSQPAESGFWSQVAWAVLLMVFFMPFIGWPTLDRLDRTFAFQPHLVIGGLGCVLFAAYRAIRSRNISWELFGLGLALVVVGLVPAFHLQTKEQALMGWMPLVLGTYVLISGLRDHLVLIRELSARRTSHG